MDLQDIYKLTPQAKNVHIALALGWKYYKKPPHDPNCLWDEEMFWNILKGSLVNLQNELSRPLNYVENLNLMHDVEKTFYAQGEKWSRYIRILESECAEGEPCGGDHIAHASAEQRANSFLILHYTDFASNG